MLGCDLPEEVLVEIFSWLPPESLIRFKCVSKSWYALINFLIRDAKFVNKHLRNIHTTYLVFRCVSLDLENVGHPEMESLRQTPLKSVTINHNVDDDGLINYVGEDFYLPTLPSEVPWKSHCKGIICLAHYESIILCNPAINEWRILPKPCLTHGGFVLLGVGFGYDLRANDFKVVRFGHDVLLGGQIEYFKFRAQVYSLRSDSWKEIEMPLEFDPNPFIGDGLFCQGVFYWLVKIDKRIISFDMFDEVFHGIPLPNNLLVTRKDHFIDLAVWNESIALFIYQHENQDAVTNSVEVWVTDDGSGAVNASCSWIRKLIIRPQVEFQFPLAFLKNDEILMQATTRCFLYNLRSQKLRNLTLEYPDSAVGWDFSYVKSLFSVQGGSHSRS